MHDALHVTLILLSAAVAVVVLFRMVSLPVILGYLAVGALVGPHALGLVEIVRARRIAWMPLALVVLSPLCVLATPYGWDIVAYYRLMLVDAPFAPILREWQWSSPSGTTALF